MTQKHALMRALDYAQSSFSGDLAKAKAARASFLISWLHDINWHPEAQALEKRTLASTHLKAPFTKLKADESKARELHVMVSLLNWLYGWGLCKAEWQATQGGELVAELWGIMNATG